VPVPAPEVKPPDLGAVEKKVTEQAATTPAADVVPPEQPLEGPLPREEPKPPPT
jgi:hypothetical protein